VAAFKICTVGSVDSYGCRLGDNGDR
jgi:hypothetical protein